MESLPDTQNQDDFRSIAIDRVGVKEIAFPVEVRDREGCSQRTVATVAMAVDLPEQYKGTHMSRFVEVLNAHGSSLDVREMAGLPREMLKRLEAQRAHVRFQFPFFRTKQAPVTKKEGLLDYEAIFDIEATSDGDFNFELTVKVPVTTLCPCSKAISKYGAHNQRGVVTLAVRFSQPVWIEDLIEEVEASASAELYSLLKRPDEKAVTEQAYENPVFVEDLVRNVAIRMNEHPLITSYKVEAENFESIHNHNAYAMVIGGV